MEIVSLLFEGKITEDAIIQNIDIGNISMPINSNLIQGAQNLFGVRADLKLEIQLSQEYFRTEISIAKYSNSRRRRLQEFSFFLWI